MALLNAAEIKRALRLVEAWSKRGRVIRRTFEFADFKAAMRFVNGVARLAERAGHHPDIDVRWNRVTLALSTHSAGGLTDQDFSLARRIDALLVRPKR
jgi:4a-hydroxytetrahydrobiopterin dehydratase